MPGDPARRRVAVVVNGRAGALLAGGGDEEAMRRRFVSAGLEPEFVAPDAGSLPERLEQARRSGAPMVVVAGGDGTVACAASVLAGSDIRLGILPFGTMNLLAKDLGLPVDDVDAALAVVADGTARPIDVGAVNGHVFLCASMLGLPARLGRYREAERERGGGWLGWLRFAVKSGRASLRYVAPRLGLEMGGRTVALRTRSLTIAVNALDDASGHLFGRSRLDGGELVAYDVDAPRLRRLPAALWRLLRQGARRADLVREHRAARLVIHSRRRGLHVMNDGERLVLAPPLRYEVRRGALQVMGGRAGC